MRRLAGVLAVGLVLALVVGLGGCESLGFHAEGSPDNVDWGISLDL